VRLELLKVQADLERELAKLVLNRQRYGMELHRCRASACPVRGTGSTASLRRTVSRWSEIASQLAGSRNFDELQLRYQSFG
jgi:hypothetical protein